MTDFYDNKKCKYANECPIEKIDATTVEDWLKGNRKFYCAKSKKEECKRDLSSDL